MFLSRETYLSVVNGLRATADAVLQLSDLPKGRERDMRFASLLLGLADTCTWSAQSIAKALVLSHLEGVAKGIKPMPGSVSELAAQVCERELPDTKVDN